VADLSQVHAEQIAYWNGAGGARWVAQQAHTDVMLAPVAEAAIAHAAPSPGDQVLDIGCGCGHTTVALSQQLDHGHVTGLDVSAPMLGVARARQVRRGNIDWICADAATHVFAPGRFDLLFSRFGVMFFGDPDAAFANLRRATRPDGRLVFACWRPLTENPWMHVPLAAARPYLPLLPEPGPNDPGPFAFADPARVTRILTGAGWAPPDFAPVTVPIDLAAGGGLDAAVAQTTEIGAAARALADQPEGIRAAAIAAIRNALEPFATKDGRVALAGGVWLVATRNR
jgi:SAM-dependent methyltransferase